MASDLHTYTDDMGYLAALHDLRGRNDGTTPIADEVNGVLGIDILKSNGAYDDEMRRLYFRVVREHPWLVVRSFLIGKPVDQLQYFRVTPELWNRRNYVESDDFGAGGTLLALRLGAAAADAADGVTGRGGGGCCAGLLDAHELLLSDRADRRSAGDLADAGHALRHILAAGFAVLLLRRDRPRGRECLSSRFGANVVRPQMRQSTLPRITPSAAVVRGARPSDAAQNHAESSVAFVGNGAAVDRPESDQELASPSHQVEPYFCQPSGP